MRSLPPFSSRIRRIASSPAPLLTVLALACGDGSTEPRIPFPMPDLTGTWNVVFTAPGAALPDGMSSVEASNTAFTGEAEISIIQLEGNVSGEYVVDGEVTVADGHGVATTLPISAAVGKLLNGRLSWDINETCGTTQAWCMSGDLFSENGTTPGAIRATVSQIHVKSPTQIDVGVFRFYLVGLVDSASTHQFIGVGTASRVN
jgi:hypothetical protein